MLGCKGLGIKESRCMLCVGYRGIYEKIYYNIAKEVV